MEGQLTSQLLPEMRTPLSAAMVKDQFLRFIQGDGQPELTFHKRGKLSTYLRTGVLGLLLAIVAWGVLGCAVATRPGFASGYGWG